MNRERAKELLPALEAFANGEDIQFHNGEGWADIEDEIEADCLDDHGLLYRIKPKPREWWLVDVTKCSNRYPHVLSPEEKEKHFADSMRYIKVREVLDEG